MSQTASQFPDQNLGQSPDKSLSQASGNLAAHAGGLADDGAGRPTPHRPGRPEGSGRSRRQPGPGERLAGYAVLSVLALLTVWLFVRQSQFNPAVIVAMNHPKGAGKLVSGQQAEAATLTASFLEILGDAALSPVESYNAETLSDKINGKAELYLASGFQEMSNRAFAAGGAAGVRVDVYLYAMESPKDAFAVLSGQRRQGAVQLSLTANAYATENAIFLTKGRFYLELIGDQASPQLRPALEAMAQTLLAALPALPSDEGQGSGADTDLFPPEGLKKDTVRLAVSDALGMEGFQNVYTAEYVLPQGEAAAFLAVRATPEEAAAQAKAYADFLAANGFKPAAPVQSLPGVTIMTMDTLVQVVMAKGRVLAGVHDAANTEAALALAAELSRTVGSAQEASKP